jgi:argininosuccinate synthase
VRVARAIGATKVAHGCTGKGNDQVRFEVSFGILAPDLEVVAPIRDPGIPREKAVALAAEWGIPIADVASSYSVDENLWGRTVECGPLEDPWVAPPEDAFERTAAPERRPSEPTEVTLAFDRGVPIALDGTALPLAELIPILEETAGRYGFGRVDMIENRRVGIKSRELYEVPAALAIIEAHRALEDLTLERDVAHAKPALEQRWSELVYDGLWFSPLREAIDAFVDATQAHVTGEVRLVFTPGACTVVGRRSDAALYDLSLATYGAGDAFDQRHAEGFVRLWGLPSKVWATKQGAARTR